MNQQGKMTEQEQVLAKKALLKEIEKLKFHAEEQKASLVNYDLNVHFPNPANVSISSEFENIIGRKGYSRFMNIKRFSIVELEEQITIHEKEWSTLAVKKYEEGFNAIRDEIEKYVEQYKKENPLKIDE